MRLNNKLHKSQPRNKKNNKDESNAVNVGDKGNQNTRRKNPHKIM
jgi:hypothetical protein